MKLSDIVESIINENIAYRMALENGIVNYSALAKKIKPRVDKLSGKDVPINTIVKFLTKFKAKDENIENYAEALSQISISLEYGYLRELMDEKDFLKTDFLIAVKDNGKYDVLYKNEKFSNLALIKLKMRESFSEIPGITVLVISILELFNIKIKNIYRVGHEIFILLDKKDGPRALEKLAYYSSVND